jgi:hypothetical protein
MRRAIAAVAIVAEVRAIDQIDLLHSENLVPTGCSSKGLSDLDMALIITRKIN